MAPSSGPRATRGAAARRTTRRLLVQQTRTRTAAGRTGEADGRSVPEAGVRTTRPQRDESRVSVRARSPPSSQLLCGHPAAHRRTRVRRKGALLSFALARRPGRASADCCLRRPLVALSGRGRRKAALTKLSAWMDDALGSHLGAY
jgi:hypothetical protein